MGPRGGVKALALAGFGLKLLVIGISRRCIGNHLDCCEEPFLHSLSSKKPGCRPIPFGCLPMPLCNVAASSSPRYSRCLYSGLQKLPRTSSSTV